MFNIFLGGLTDFGSHKEKEIDMRMSAIIIIMMGINIIDQSVIFLSLCKNLWPQRQSRALVLYIYSAVYFKTTPPPREALNFGHLSSCDTIVLRLSPIGEVKSFCCSSQHCRELSCNDFGDFSANVGNFLQVFLPTSVKVSNKFNHMPDA